MRKTAEEWILELLKAKHPLSMTSRKLIRESKCSPSAVHTATAKMAREGSISRVETGEYVWNPAQRQAPLFEAEQTVSARLVESQPIGRAIAVSDLQAMEDEPRVRDLRLGERLGYARSYKIRELVKANEAELLRYGPLPRVGGMVAVGSGAQREVQEYWLNEAQSLLLVMKSNTDIAVDARQEIIAVFLAYRHGKLQPAQPSDNSAILTYFERLDRAADQRHREMIQFMAENNKAMAGMMMEIRHSTVAPMALPDNIRQLDQKLFEGTIFGLRKAPRHTVKRQGAAARRLADLMDKPASKFSRHKLQETLKWMGVVKGFENRYHEGDLLTAPAVNAGYESWFVWTIDEINDRHAWTWALTDEGMRQLERMHPEIKAWLEEAA